jgi:hypothetical protein
MEKLPEFGMRNTFGLTVNDGAYILELDPFLKSAGDELKHEKVER